MHSWTQSWGTERARMDRERQAAWQARTSKNAERSHGVRSENVKEILTHDKAFKSDMQQRNAKLEQQARALSHSMYERGKARHEHSGQLLLVRVPNCQPTDTPNWRFN